MRYVAIKLIVNIYIVFLLLELYYFYVQNNNFIEGKINIDLSEMLRLCVKVCKSMTLLFRIDWWMIFIDFSMK